MSTEIISDASLDEARRQLQICNACRYCEGYCSAFPAITRLRSFSDGDITQIANLCHNCRGCYYACQYTAPHEFDLNLPQALAEVRRESWEAYVWPQAFGRLFQTHAWATIGVTALGFALLFAAIRMIGSAGGEGFYAVLSHTAMVAIFAPVFLLPLVGVAVGLWAYWRDVGGKTIRWQHLRAAFTRTARMQDLSGGHGDGCNFEEEERYSHARRYAHQAVLYGFLLCFASTSAGTVLHYVFDQPAPYPLFSLPKLFGVPGGILLTLGCVWMIWLKMRADRNLSDTRARAAETAFIALLGFVAFSGLALYALGTTSAMPALLAIHLGAVFAFFVLTPFTKMTHGFFRLAALVKDAQDKAPG